jgi:hypothetical protein
VRGDKIFQAAWVIAMAFYVVAVGMTFWAAFANLFH